MNTETNKLAQPSGNPGELAARLRGCADADDLRQQERDDLIAAADALAQQPAAAQVQEPFGWHLVSSGPGRQEMFTRSPIMTELVKAGMAGDVDVTPLYDHPQIQAPAAAGVPAEQQGGWDAPIDVTDPWRGLYRAERLRANGDGDLYHPDLPSWPDDREDALDKLVRAQGFDFQVVAGEFTEEAAEDDSGELYWQEMRAWIPAAPAGGWRLAWKGDTEDGPYAWFVRPMALRPNPESLAARQPVGQDRIAIKLLVAAGFVAEAKANEALCIAHGFGGDLGEAEHKAVPDGWVLVPLELADRVRDSLGRFTSDEGWGQPDMDAADDFSAYVAAPGAQEVGNG